MDVRFMFMLLTVHFLQCNGKLSCMDNNGNPVDWFIVYKLPRELENTNPLIRDGVAYMYMDVNNQFFSLSTVSMNDTNQAVAYTLQQIYENYKSKSVTYMMYSDLQPGPKHKSTRGHLKGDIGFDSDTGLWLSHSVPSFPPYANSTYVWPFNALRNGHSFFCVSLKASEFVTIGNQLLYDNPLVYDASIPDSFRSRFAVLVNVSAGQRVQEPPWNKSVVITSLGGQEFIMFAKYSLFNDDLYSYWVAPALGDSLYAETWRNTYRRLSSFCEGMYHVENVESMSFPGVLTFKRTVDNSKWAIGVHKKWTCLGDIDRSDSQTKEGGGAVCMQIDDVWSAFNSTILTVEKCPK